MTTRAARTPTPDARPSASRDPDDLQTTEAAHAEQAVLGAMLTDPATIDAVQTHIDPGAYYQPRHTVIHQAITALHGEGTQPDPITVLHRLTTGGHVKPGLIDGPYLHTLIAAVPTTANAGHYAAQVADQHRRRALTEAAAYLNQAATTDQPTGRDSFIDRARQALAAATTTVLADPNEAIDTWLPMDLEAALSGGVITPPPVLLERVDGVCLLYMGRLHSLAGEPESGKTWIALLAALQSLAVGLHVIYLDFEDTPEGIVGRLLALGAHPDRIRTGLHYIRPDRPTDDDARARLAQLVADHPAALCVIDGVTEAMTLHGLDPYNNPDAARFYEALPRALIRLPDPPAVLMIDHVPKDEDRPKRYAIGAQHKLAGLDGAAYVVDIVKPFAPGQPGISRIRVAKDRPGQVRRHARGGTIAELHIGGDDPVVTAHLRVPLPSVTSDAPDKHWRPTMLMDRVSKWLEAHPGASQNDIEKAVRGRSTNVRAAVEALVLEKYVRREPGENRQWKHFIKEPFREVEVINLEGDET